jgi:hypothetical protein
MMKIKLVDHLLYTLVDDEDYPVLSRYDWYLLKTKVGNRYAHTKIDDNWVYMHQMVLPSPSVDLTPDHKDGDGLNNQKENLRLATKSQQGFNSKKRKNTSSTYRGVSWSERDKCWRAQIMVNHKYIHLGTFQSEISAAKAYNRAAKEYCGEFAVLNVIPIIKVS